MLTSGPQFGGTTPDLAKALIALADRLATVHEKSGKRYQYHNKYRTFA
jgi:hypothetical protein